MTIDISKQRVFRVLIDRLGQRRIVRAAVDRAYSAFKQNHQQWTQSLLDKHFIMQIIAPWLTTPETADRVLTPFVFAAAWAAQLSTQPGRQRVLVAQCLPVAVEFLRLLQKELPAEQTILPILVQHHIDRKMAVKPRIPALSEVEHYV